MQAADAIPVVEKRRFADKATWTPTFCDTGTRHNFKEKYHYAFLSSGARIQHNNNVARLWSIIEQKLEELNQLRDKYDYHWSDDYKDLVKAHDDHLAARCTWRNLKFVDPREKAQAAKEELEEQVETREWLKGLCQVLKQERQEEAEKKAAKTKKPTAAEETGGGAKLPGVGEREVAKATSPLKPTPTSAIAVPILLSTPIVKQTVVPVVKPVEPTPASKPLPEVTSSASTGHLQEQQLLERILRVQEAEQKTLELQLRVRQHQQQSAALRAELERANGAGTQAANEQFTCS
eukprot:290472-Rhodomonas_salina.1